MVFESIGGHLDDDDKKSIIDGIDKKSFIDEIDQFVSILSSKCPDISFEVSSPRNGYEDSSINQIIELILFNVKFLCTCSGKGDERVYLHLLGLCSFFIQGLEKVFDKWKFKLQRKFFGEFTDFCVS